MTFETILRDEYNKKFRMRRLPDRCYGIQCRGGTWILPHDTDGARLCIYLTCKSQRQLSARLRKITTNTTFRTLGGSIAQLGDCEAVLTFRHDVTLETPILVECGAYYRRSYGAKPLHGAAKLARERAEARRGTP